MDDSYIIHNDKTYLRELLKEIIKIAQSLGLTLNLKKTQIIRLSDTFKYLQIRYTLTDTGSVIKRINKKRLTAFRRKFKKLSHILNATELNQWYTSWFMANYQILSNKQRENLNNLYKEVIKCTK